MNVKVRKALTADVKAIHMALLSAAGAGLLLPRSLSDLYGHVRDFIVLEGPDGSISGFCALAVLWEDTSEIRSLLLEERLRGRGLGRILVEACLEEARALGTPKVFTLTYQTEFFSRLGFAEMSKESLSQKIWVDCVHCPKFPDACDETAMVRRV